MKRVESVLIALVCAALALLFLYLTGYGLFFTSIIDRDGYIHEPIEEIRDSWGQSLLGLACGALALWLFGRVEKRIPLKVAVAAAILWAVAAGAFWVCSARVLPRADAGFLTTAARRIIDGNYSEVRRASGYLNQHPYQVGYLLVSEIMQRVFGKGNVLALQLFNVAALAGAYGAALRLTWRAAGSARAVRYAALLLMLCVQPVLYCTFLYGNMLSICCALWAAATVLGAARGGKAWRLPLAGLLCGLSVMAKPNGWIPSLALLIVTALWLLSQKKWKWLPLLACFLLGPLLVTGGVKALYSSRAKADLSQGVPMTAYLAMGLQESSRAPGWYNEYVDRVYKGVQYNPEKASARAVKNIRMRLNEFADDPAYAARFFHEKMVSQWNETTFEAIWIGAVCQHEKTQSPFARSVLEGDLREPFERWMERYTLLLYACFTAGLGLLAAALFKRGAPVERSLGFGLGFAAITVLGAFLYHMLFEAKSQYLFVYLLVMIPVAGWAASEADGAISAWCSRRKVARKAAGV